MSWQISIHVKNLHYPSIPYSVFLSILNDLIWMIFLVSQPNMLTFIKKLLASPTLSPQDFFHFYRAWTFELYINSGSKENIYAGKKCGLRQYVQKCFLLWTIRAIRDLFQIVKGVQLDIILNIEVFEDAFGHELPFTCLYNFIKSR